MYTCTLVLLSHSLVRICMYYIILPTFYSELGLVIQFDEEFQIILPMAEKEEKVHTKSNSIRDCLREFKSGYYSWKQFPSSPTFSLYLICN